jgi:hypothetical protein
VSAGGDQGTHLYRYEDILRAIGRYVDEHNLQDVVLVQLEGGILLRGLSGRRLVEHLFDAEELKRIDDEATRLRRSGRR